MAYCLEADVRRKVTVVPADTLGTNQIADGIAAGDAEIDARLIGRYTVPFSPVPELIKRISILLAAGWALGDAYAGTGPNVPVAFAENCLEEGRKLLELLATGELALGTTATPVSSTSPPMMISTFGETSRIAAFDPYGGCPPAKLPGFP